MWRTVFNRLILTTVFIICLILMIGALTNSIRIKGGNTPLSRISLGIAVFFMAIMLVRLLLDEWRDFRSIKTKAMLRISPVQSQKIEVGSISGSGISRIDVQISLKNIKQQRSAVYCSLHLDHNGNRQTKILGYVPLPEKDALKSFHVYKSLPDEFEVAKIQFNVDVKDYWERHLSVEFLDPTSHQNIVELQITAYSDGTVSVDLSKLMSFIHKA